MTLYQFSLSSSKPPPFKILRKTYIIGLTDEFSNVRLTKNELTSIVIRRKLQNFERKYFFSDREVYFREEDNTFTDNDIIDNMYWKTVEVLFNKISSFEKRLEWFVSNWIPFNKPKETNYKILNKNNISNKRLKKVLKNKEKICETIYRICPCCNREVEVEVYIDK